MEVTPPPAQWIIAMSPEEFFKNTVPCDCSVHYGDFRDCERDFRFKVAGLIEWARDEAAGKALDSRNDGYSAFDLLEQRGAHKAIADYATALTRLAEEIIKE